MAEEELYSQRSKLYCFRDDSWRERGVGEAKLLKDPEKGVRFLMAQERTGRILANCLVVEHNTYYDLRFNAGSDKCWVWSAQDCSEEEMKTEQFALKFGSAELAKAFQVAFNKAKATNTAMGVPSREEVYTAQETVSSTSPFANLAGSSIFSPAAGLFSTPPASGGLFSSASSGGGLFASTGGLFGSMSFAAVSSAPGSFNGGTIGGSAPASGGLFAGLGSTSGSQAASGTGGPFAPATGGLFSGLGQTGGLTAATGSLFSGFGSGSGGQTAGAAGSGGLFAAPATGSIFNGLGAAAPGSAQAEPAAEGEEDAEEEVTTVPGWEPSVTLPVLERVETGQEEEDELYSQRSKLLRFRGGEWKERGLGEAKLLQHRQSKMVRFFMRQERTGKIVANHFVVDAPSICQLAVNAGNTKCWVWMVQDYADEEPVMEQFALKFGTVELAAGFKEAFDRAKELNARNMATGAAGENAEPAPAAAQEETETPAAGHAAAAESSSATGGSASQAPAAAQEAPEMYRLLMQLQRKVEEQEETHKREIAELNASWEAKFEELQQGSGQELALAERDRAKAQVCSLLSNLQDNFEDMMAQVSQVQREVSGSGPACLADAPAAAVGNSGSARTVHSLEKKVETLCSLLSTLAEELRSTDERLASCLAEQKAAAEREVAQLRDSLSPELAALLKRVSTLQRSFRREVDEWEPKVDGKLDLFRQEVRGELGVAVAAIKRQLLSVTRRVEELELAGGLDDA